MIAVDLKQFEIEYNEVLTNPYHCRIWVQDPTTKDIIIIYGAVVGDVKDAVHDVAEVNGYEINGLE